MTCSRHSARSGGHPRVGGGTKRWRRLATAPRGPSPRGRGNHGNGSVPARRHGAIPAWAGEPASNTTVPGTAGGHPRVGGGTIRDRGQYGTARGPSPRGRGNHVQTTVLPSAIGAIPAWAGEPCCCRIKPRRAGGHPRVGGGTYGMNLAGKWYGGPSPRGRGNLPNDVPCDRAVGAIPAWAGEPPA